MANVRLSSRLIVAPPKQKGTTRMATKTSKPRKRKPAALPVCPRPVANILQRLLRTSRHVSEAERKTVYDFINTTKA